MSWETPIVSRAMCALDGSPGGPPSEPPHATAANAPTKTRSVPTRAPRDRMRLERLIGEAKVVECVSFKVVPGAFVDHLAHPAPVERDPIAWAGVVRKAVTVELPGDAGFLLRAEAEPALDQRQRRPADEQRTCLGRDDPPPAHPARVHSFERVLERPGAAVHIEYVEVVMGPGANAYRQPFC